MRLVPRWVDSCHPATSVAVTIAGISTTIFGMNLVVNSMRAGTERLPRIGPMTNPRNRSMTVHPAPNTTCMNSSDQSPPVATTTISATRITPASTRPTRGTISKSGIADWGTGVSSASGRLWLAPTQ